MHPDEPFREDVPASSPVKVHTVIEFWTPQKEFFITIRKVLFTTILPNKSAWMTGEKEAIEVTVFRDPVGVPVFNLRLTKMEAIRTLQAIAEIGLKEAKDFIDKLDA